MRDVCGHYGLNCALATVRSNGDVALRFSFPFRLEDEPSPHPEAQRLASAASVTSTSPVRESKNGIRDRSVISHRVGASRGKRLSWMIAASFDTSPWKESIEACSMSAGATFS